jgi:hypothetical protein
LMGRDMGTSSGYSCAQVINMEFNFLVNRSLG